MSTIAWAKPGITVLSVAAITTIGFAPPASASGSHPLPVPSASSYRAIVAAIHSATSRTMSAHDITTLNGLPPIPGTGEQASPEFGAGKEVVYVEPMPGTFPAGTTPDLTKVTFGFHQTMTDGTNTQDVDIDCSNESTGPTDPLTPCANVDAPLQLDQPFTIGFDAAHSTLPSGFLAPGDVTDTVSSTLPTIAGPLISGNFAAHAIDTSAVTGCTEFPIQPPVKFCNQSKTVQIPGAWRPVGLDLASKVSGAPLANSKFVLSQGSTTLGSATTDNKGHLTFPGVYLGGNYTLTQKSSPAGYAAVGGPLGIKVPAITTVADAGQEYDVPVKLSPLPPNAVDDAMSTSQDQSAVVKVLTNDVAVSAPLTITAVGKPSHGKAIANPDGTITYTPAAGYSGSDTFTYSVRNLLGGTDAAVVTITVVRTQVLGDRLPMTGRASWLESELGLGSVVIGGLLVAAGRRRRRPSH